MVRVVASVVKSDHKAVVAFPDNTSKMPKTKRQHAYRPHTPAQHAQFLQHAANIDFTNRCTTASSDPAVNAQFDHFYMVAKQHLEEYYPDKVVTMTSRDPEYITPPPYKGHAAPEKQAHAQ